MANEMNPAERRTSVRKPAEGEVRLWLEPFGPAVNGRLLNRSEGGFRATHDHVGLSAGQEVRFTDAAGSGRARVVWTRVLPGQVESGFVVL